MLNLTLHCGGHAVERDRVDACPTPPATPTWQPIPHAHLLDLVVQTLSHAGLSVVNQAHALSREGQRYFGLMQVRNGQTDRDYGFVVGVRNSHDQSFPAALCVGSAVFVCDNLAFSGSVVLARKHTRFIVRDLPQLVGRAVGQLGTLRQDQDDRLAAYKATAVSDRLAHHLLVSLIDARVLPVTRLPGALQQWREPDHAQFAEAGKTGWRLFNAVTESIKGRNLDQLPRRTQALHGILDTHCGIARN